MLRFSKIPFSTNPLIHPSRSSSSKFVIRRLIQSEKGTTASPEKSAEFVQKRFVPLASVSLLTVASIGLLPQFENTREGLEIAWKWKDIQYEETTAMLEAWAWQFWIAISGLMAGYGLTNAAIKKSLSKPNFSTILTSFKVPLLVFGGVFGAKLTTSLARPVTDAFMFIGRFVEFFVEGIQADIFGKPRHELTWVKNGMDVTLKHKHGRGKNKKEQEAVPYETKSGDVLRDLALVQGDLNDPKTCGPYRHKLLLVQELGRLRQQERMIADAGTTANHKLTHQKLQEIRQSKKWIKNQCKEIYGFKIGRLFEEIEREAAMRLEDLREEQRQKVMKFEDMNEIVKLDKEKATLKARAKLALGVKLSTLTKPSPTWKSVMKDRRQMNY